MPNREFLDIIFAVRGGGSISGESGSRIKKELESIANNIKLKVSIDVGHFTTQIEQAYKQVETNVGKIANKMAKIGADAGKTASKGAEDVAKAQSDAYKEARRLIKEQHKMIDKEFSSRRMGGDVRNQITRIADDIDRQAAWIEDIYSDGKKGVFNLVSEDQYNKLVDYKKQLQEMSALKYSEGEFKDLSLPLSYKSAQANAESLVERYRDLREVSSEAAATMGRLEQSARVPLSDEPAKAAEQIRQLAAQTKDANRYFARLSVETDTFGRRLQKAFNKKIIDRINIALTALITRGLQSAYQSVIQLDKATTDLQVVTGKTREEVKALIIEYAKMGKELGATAVQVAESADTFLRQGYTMAETNKLIKDSLMLSKLGQISSAEASKVMTSSIKGYGLAVEESTSIVDKFTAVDRHAAVSAGYLGKALSETAVSANMAGLSMDRIVGMIAAVGEVSQDGAESVGTFYKTLLARMGNVKIGKFVDDETGEDLSDMERVLTSLNISLRDSHGTFRSFGDVLDDIGSKWSTFNDVQRSAIAVAAAGTRQQEKFKTLMVNYGNAMDYATVASTSAGTALQKFNDAYANSLEAKIQSLTAVRQELAASILDTSVIGFFLDMAKSIGGVLVSLTQFGGGLLVMIPALLGGITVLRTVITTIWDKLKVALPETLSNLKNIILFTDKQVEARKRNLTAIYEETRAEKEKQIAVLRGQIETQKLTEDEISLRKLKIEQINQELNTMEHSHEKQLATVKKGGINTAIIGVLTLLTTLNVATKGWGKTAQHIIGWTTAVVSAVTLAFVAINLVTKKFMLSNPLGWIMAAISALLVAIDTLRKAFGSLTLKELKEKALDAKNAFEDVSSELENVSSKLDDVAQKIDELKSKEDLTVVEKDELKRLQSISDEIKAQKSLLADRARELKVLSEASTLDVIDKITKKQDYKKALKNIDNWDKAKDKDKDKAREKIRELTDQLEQIEYYNNPTTAHEIASNEAFKKINDLQDKMLQLNGKTLGDAWSIILGRADLKDGVATLRKIADSGEDIQESIRAMYETNPEIKRFVDYLDDIWDTAIMSGDGMQSLTKTVESFRTSIVKTSAEVLSYNDIISDMQKGYDALLKGLQDIKSGGILSADSMKAVLDNDVLKKYFKETDYGFILGDEYTAESHLDILKKYIESGLQKYVNELDKYNKQFDEVQARQAKGIIIDGELEQATKNQTQAQENLNKAMASGQIILRSTIIAEEIDNLNKRKDAYEKIINIRKKLLTSYKKEIDYQKQLEQKQKSVADLQTKLRLAKMDTSAYGQARVRELESELQNAQEALDDFTLEHAINLLVEQLDSDYDDYIKSIQSQTEEIVKAIDKLAVKLVPPSPEPVKQPQKGWSSYKDAADAGYGNIAGASPSEKARVTEWLNPSTGKNYTNYQEYLDEMYKKYVGEFHTGGMVGNAKLGENEVFAKLLKGEVVSTPLQVSRFMQKTLPSMASLGGNIFNAPLIELSIASATQESIPDIKDIVNKAVRKIQSDLSSGFNRNKVGKQVDKFTTN